MNIFSPRLPMALALAVSLVACGSGGGGGVGYGGSSAIPTPTWGTASLIEFDDRGDANLPAVAMDTLGNAVAVWTQSDGTAENVLANRYVAGSGWGTPVEIDDVANDAILGAADVAVDGNGNAIAVWEQSGAANIANVYANRYTPATGWGNAVLIEHSTNNAFSLPRVRVDDSGNAVAVWLQSDGSRLVVRANRYDAATDAWGPTAATLDAADPGDAYAVQVAVNASGDAIATWEQSDGTRYNIWAARYDAASSAWGASTRLETDDGNAILPTVAMNGAGTAIVAWEQSDGIRDNIWASRYDAGSGSWSAPALIESDDRGDAEWANAAVDADGNALVVWDQSDGTRYNILANRYDAASATWGNATLVETDDTGDAWEAQVGMDAAGNAVAVWVHYDGSSGAVRANRFDAAGGRWESAAAVDGGGVICEYPALAVNAAGQATVVWQQLNATGSGFDAYGNVLP